MVADERNVVRLRTNYRPGETAYLYRVQADKQPVHQVSLDYLRSINQLADQPAWHNALLHNCTTQLRGHFDQVAWDWRILANGYADALVNELKMGVSNAKNECSFPGACRRPRRFGSHPAGIEYYAIVGANLYLSKNWLMSVGVRGSSIAGDPGDSPVVAQRGDSTRWMGGIGIGSVMW